MFCYFHLYSFEKIFNFILHMHLKANTNKRLILRLSKYFHSANNVYKEFKNFLLPFYKLKEQVFIFDHFLLITNFYKIDIFARY